MADDVEIRIGATVDGLNRGVEQAKTSIASLTEAAQGAAAAIAAVFSLDKLANFIESMAQLGEQTERMSRILGVSTEQVGTFSLMAKLTGGSTEQLSHSMELFSFNLQRAQSGTGTAAEALKVMHLNARDLLALGLEGAISRIGTEFAKWSDGMQKTAIARALFGRGFESMLPVLDMGGSGMAKLRDEAERLGIALNIGTVGPLADLDRSMIKLRTSAESLGATLVAAVANRLAEIYEWTAKIIGQFTLLVRGWAGLNDTFMSKGATSAPNLEIPNRDSIKQSLANLDILIDQAKSRFDRFKMIYAEDATVHRISEGEKFQYTREALAAEEKTVRERYAQELAVAGLTAGEIADIRRKMSKALEKIDTESLQLRLDQEKTFVAQWNSLGDSMLSSWNTHMRGLLAGTETFATAFKQTLGDLVIKFIEFVEKIIVEWLALKLATAFGSPLELAGHLKTIAGDTGQLYAGFAAFYAPFLGPGAAAAAATETAAVQATAVGMSTASFETGAWEIPHTMLATVHAGEMVIPSAPAQAIREGGGGVTVNLSVTGRLMQGEIRAHADEIARVVSRALQTNPSMRPGYTG